MQITQGHKSASLGDFKFMELFSLSTYTDSTKPLVMYGCYNEYDYNIVRNHKAQLVIIWLGLDSKCIIDSHIFKASNIVNVSEKRQIQTILDTHGIGCMLIKPLAFTSIGSPVTLGNKVYSYVHKNDPEYYGSKIIEQINTPYEILIADYTIKQSEWYGGVCESYYSQAFVGLALSSFCGGGTSILELGLRGIRCITNVLQTPNAIPFQNVKGIEAAIKDEAMNIGTVNNKLIEQMKESCVCMVQDGFRLRDLMI